MHKSHASQVRSLVADRLQNASRAANIEADRGKGSSSPHGQLNRVAIVEEYSAAGIMIEDYSSRYRMAHKTNDMGNCS